MNEPIQDQSDTFLINKISLLIEQSKKQVVIQSNSVLTQLFWEIGSLINQYIL